MTYTTQHGVTVPDWSTASEEEIEEGYRQQAEDEKRDPDVMAWIESDFGECL